MKTTRHSGHLQVTIRGRRTRESVSRMANEILDACREHGVDSVLVDVREFGQRLNIFDTVRIVKEDFTTIRNAGILKRAAIVDRSENLLRLRFFERLARSRDYNLRTFDNPDEATRWIITDDWLATV